MALIETNDIKTRDPEDRKPVDPWRHRARGMKCLTCMWFVMKVPEHTMDAPEFGRCRRHAPNLSGYPAVFGTDWCGDHKLDEEKI